MSDPEIICLSDSEDEAESKENKPIKSETKPKVKSERGLSQSTADDEVEVVDASTIQQPVVNASTAELGSDDELELVGTANETLLPHARHDCLVCRYQSTNFGRDNNTTYSAEEKEKMSENAKFCKLCYCWICDRPAAECNDWYLGERGVCVDTDGGSADGEEGGESDGNSAAEDGHLKMAKSDGDAAVGSHAKQDGAAEKSATAAGTDEEQNVHQSTTPAAAGATTTTTTAAKASSDKSDNAEDHADSTKPAAKSDTTTKSLSQSDQLLPHHNHSQATATGPLKTFWHNMRLAIRQNQDPSQVSRTNTRTRAEIEAEAMQRYADNYGDALQQAITAAIGGGMLARHRRVAVSRRRVRSNPVPSRRRTRPRNSSLSPNDHRQRIRAQNMLESLYSNPDGW